MTKKFQFRLRTVQRVRRIEEDRARAELLAANHAVALAQQEVDLRRAQYWDAPRPTATTAASEFRSSWLDIDLAAQGVQWSTARRIERAAAADERRTEWLARRTRVDALDRLELRAREEWLVELRRDEDRAVDDLVVSRSRRAGPTAPSTNRPSGDRPA